MHAIAAFVFGMYVAVSSWFGVSNTVPPHQELIATGTPIEEVATSTPGVLTPTMKKSGTPQTDTSLVTLVDTTGASSSTAKTSTLFSLPTGSPWLTSLTLGDGKYSTSGPKKGYVYVCHVMSGGKGSMVDGPWIHGTTWNPSEKLHVEGEVAWPAATYHMSVSGNVRTITSNDLPTDHTTGAFPIGTNDPAAQYDRNPSSIAAHTESFSLPANPSKLLSPGCIYGEVGIMNNGVLLFDGFDALYRDALAHELEDDHDGHPNQEGYHKHGFISDIKNVAVSQVVGFAFDGYPITGPKLPSGKYVTTNDLDECHGLTSAIILDGKTQDSYHYVLTQDFPYSVSCFRGTSKVTPGRLQGAEMTSRPNSPAFPGNEPDGARGGTPPAPPQEAKDACTGKSIGASCSVGENITGSCATIGMAFACLPQR